MFLAALFTSQKLEQLQWVSTVELINKMWLTHTMEYNLVLYTYYDIADLQKRHVKWKKPDTKSTYWMIQFIWNVQKKQIYRDGK